MTGETIQAQTMSGAELCSSYLLIYDFGAIATYEVLDVHVPIHIYRLLLFDYPSRSRSFDRRDLTNKTNQTPRTDYQEVTSSQQPSTHLKQSHASLAGSSSV